MKLGETGNKVESSGLSDTGSFSIKNSPHAFQILSSGLYSNKIRAVIRELSCNAVDAHTSAGNKNPIEVKLPNALDKQFYVKDFGTGLTHDQVMKLYTTYFESTKQESNDFIGGLGVGSKSPFAYTDSFTVESRKDGVKRLYAAYLSENGTPAISLMGEEPSNEPNGMTIGFPVSPDDFKEFSNEAISVFQSFKTTPTLRGVSFTISPISLSDLNKITDTVYTVKENTRFPWVNSVRMGNVVYPMDVKKIANGDEWLEWIAAKQGLFLDVPIGTYSVAASREQLQYDPSTVAAFNKDMSGLKTHWIANAERMLKNVAKETNEYDKKRKIFAWLQEQGLTHGHFYYHNKTSPEKILSSLRKNHGVDIPVVPAHTSITVATQHIKVVEPYVSERNGVQRVVWPNPDNSDKKLSQMNVHLDYSSQIEVIYADSKQFRDIVSARILENEKEHKANPSKAPHKKFIIITERRDGDDVEVKKELDAALKQIGVVEPVLVSSMPKPTAGSIPKAGAATKKEEIRAAALVANHEWGDNWAVSAEGMKVLSNAESFVWLPYTPSSKEYDGKELTDAQYSNLGYLLESLKTLEEKLKLTPTKVYAVNTIYRKRMDQFPDAIKLEDHIAKLLENPTLKKHIDTPRVLIKVEADSNSRGYGYHGRNDFTKLDNLAKAIKDRKFGKRLHETLPKDAVDSRIAHLCLSVNSMFGKPIGTLKNITVVDPEKVQNFISKNYPLITTDVYSDNYSGSDGKTRIPELNKYLEWKDTVDPIDFKF